MHAPDILAAPSWMKIEHPRSAWVESNSGEVERIKLSSYSKIGYNLHSPVAIDSASVAQSEISLAGAVNSKSSSFQKAHKLWHKL